MKCEPQGYKIAVSDFLEANENWSIWEKTRYVNTRIQCVENAYSGLLNKYIFRLSYEKIKNLIEKHLNGSGSILSSILISDDGEMIYHWREPSTDIYYSNIQKAKLIREDFMWVDWQVLDFVQKNIKRGRYASGKWI